VVGAGSGVIEGNFKCGIVGAVNVCGDAEA
jgi:hypothetical protein